MLRAVKQHVRGWFQYIPDYKGKVALRRAVSPVCDLDGNNLAKEIGCCSRINHREKIRCHMSILEQARHIQRRTNPGCQFIYVLRLDIKQPLFYHPVDHWV